MPYNPMTDGLVQCFNRNVQNMLKMVILDNLDAQTVLSVAGNPLSRCQLPSTPEKSQTTETNTDVQQNMDNS